MKGKRQKKESDEKPVEVIRTRDCHVLRDIRLASWDVCECLRLGHLGGGDSEVRQALRPGPFNRFLHITSLLVSISTSLTTNKYQL